MDEARAKQLGAGSGHYTAFVGPPKQYDFMGATQFRLLCALGLRDVHRVLDFGCGSLRAGRLLIPYLLPDRYFGIEPNSWLIEDAIERQIGADMVRIKRPQFSDSDAFTANVFAEKFDFILAQSVFSHTGPALASQILTSFAEKLHPEGICAVTFIKGGKGAVAEGWKYPGCVKYPDATIKALVEGAGLESIPIPWYHPRQSWFLLALQKSALPAAKDVHLLDGAVLRAPEFAASVRREFAA